MIEKLRQKNRLFLLATLILACTADPILGIAASAPPKIVFSFGGFNERSGILFVAKDTGIFQRHGLDAPAEGGRSG